MGISAEEIKKRAYQLENQIIKDRRHLPQIAEIGTDLPKTSAYIQQRLTEMGISWKACGGALPEKLTADFVEAGFPKMEKATGVLAQIGHGSPCILLRADMDALPLKEDSGLEFQSCSSASHMCGHDSHAAMLLGAAQILKEHEDQLHGSVKLMFQPGEETGTIGYAAGVNSASLDTFILNIQGSGGHGSQPQLCTDPLMILNQVYQALNLLVTREADPAAMVTLTCGVAKGGTAVNIIPDKAELHIGMRTLDVEAAEHLKQRIPEMIDHYVKAWNGTYELTEFHTPARFPIRDCVKASFRILLKSWERTRSTKSRL